MTRREQILDGAIAVLGKQGSRALTHRAVDAAAGVPMGTTSNYFRTREALIDGMVDRFTALERRAWEQITAAVRPQTADEVAAALTAFVHEAVGPQRTLTLARYAIFLEAARQPELQARLAASAAEIRRWGSVWLELIGSARPLEHTEFVLDHLDGLILHQLAFPDADFEPYPVLLRLLTNPPPRSP